RTRASPSWSSSITVGGGTVPAVNLTRQEVQRPRPPQVAVMSTPAACAARSMVVPGATWRVRASGSTVSPTVVMRTEDSTAAILSGANGRQTYVLLDFSRGVADISTT